MIRRWTGIGALAGTVCFTLAAANACSGGDGARDEPAVATTSVGITDDPEAIGDYEPTNIKVRVGDEVTWRNTSSTAHNVVFSGKAPPSSELFDRGETFAARFPDPGRYPYVCSIHPAMTGSITVG